MNFLPEDIVIVSYPKSGSTWLRFILANAFWPDVEHDFDSVHRLIPSLDSKEMEQWERTDPQFFKSHAFEDPGYPNVIYLVRHPGDILISFWNHKRKFYQESRSIEDYCSDNKYGADWRKHVDYWTSRENVLVIRYEDLFSGPEMSLLMFDRQKIKQAAKKSSFSKLHDIERHKGIGHLYTEHDSSIPFIRSGKKDQWKDLPLETYSMILLKNRTQLNKFNYADRF